VLLVLQEQRVPQAQLVLQVVKAFKVRLDPLAQLAQLDLLAQQVLVTELTTAPQQKNSAQEANHLLLH
jgi:hypothetical protein